MVSAGLFVLRFGVPAGDWFPLVAGCLGGVRLVALLCFVVAQQMGLSLAQQDRRFFVGVLVRLFGACSAVLLNIDKRHQMLSGKRAHVGPLGGHCMNKSNVHLYLRISFFPFPLGPVRVFSPVVVE